MGRWDHGGAWKTIDFMPHVLEEQLVKGGFEAQAAIKTWRDRGWLEHDPRGLKRSVRFHNGSKVQVYSIRRKSLEEILGFAVAVK
jgi:hypothetical protein